MAFAGKDAWATFLTACVVLTFAATDQGWDVPLVGSSHRWAAVAITILGIATCSLGTNRGGTATMVLSVLGTLALALCVWAIASGSMTPLQFLVADIVVLWIVSTVRHAAHPHATRL